MPKQKLSEIEIMKAYKAAGLFESDSAFADDLSVSRQTMSQWLNDIYKPQSTWLRLTALLHKDNWRGKMCVDLLNARGLEDDIPCVCLEKTGDNGPCPKHGHGSTVSAPLRVSEKAGA